MRSRYLHHADHGGSCGSGGGGCCSSGGKGEPKDAALKTVQLGISVGAKAKADVNRPTTVVEPFAGTEKYAQGLMIGLDVGSTTVKAVVINPLTDEILWKDYQRHDTKQPEKVIEFLTRIEAEFPDVPTNAFRLFITGSGGSGLIKRIGGKFVQEVNAVSLAVEKLYPEVQSVIELGGQDAKIIVFKEDPETGKKKKIPSMNDKCAGGTGAVIDKINAKLKIPAEQLCNMGYKDIRLHPVAGKCGVFAETDINGLQKTGVAPDELMASLFESIIQQNLSVLTRGHTLKPTVLLLGGPNCYIKGMRDCWKHNIPVMWKERNVELPDPSKAPEDYIITPENAQYFAAIGVVEFAKIEVEDDPNLGVYHGMERLKWYIEHGRAAEKAAAGAKGLVKTSDELDAFKSRFKKEKWTATPFAPGTVVEAFMGIDGGSTSSKGVLVDKGKNVIAKFYQLSKGNPIEDTMDICRGLDEQITGQGCTLKILGVGTTGYAKDILKDVLKADVGLVETVAHTEAGLHFYPGTDVIVDVGGQDIKLIILRNGSVKDFKLNTQCSAGNGYFLQSTATGFGFDVHDYADIAFSAQAMPEFGYGCAVFMQSDIVDFQRQGWQPNEIMAGLAAVLPKNIWLYVSQIPNLAKLGTKFVLQGGTQHNLAAVKSQVDFIESRFVGTGVTPEVIVHKHCGESGAIGCAIEAHRLYHECDLKTTFIGLERVQRIQYRTTREEATRCYFCKNKCLRTFIDVKTGDGPQASSLQAVGANDGVRVSLTSQIIKIGPEAGHPTRIKHGPPAEVRDGNHAPAGAAADIRTPHAGGGRGSEANNAASVGQAGSSTIRSAQLVGSTPTTSVAGSDGAVVDPAVQAKDLMKKASTKSKSKVPLQTGEQRLIIATCEKGTVEDINDMRDIKSGLDAVKKANPNLMEVAAHDAFKEVVVEDVSDPLPRGSVWSRLFRTHPARGGRATAVAPATNGSPAAAAPGGMAKPAAAGAAMLCASGVDASQDTGESQHGRPGHAQGEAPSESRTLGHATLGGAAVVGKAPPTGVGGSDGRRALMERRKELRIGFPRVLNMYGQAPFFMGYFQSLGVPARNLVYSEYTSTELYKRGAKRGSIDPCFPSKLGIPHVHDLLYVQHEKKPLTHIFFPMVDSFPTFLEHVQDSRACPTVVATTEATHAAFIKEGDLFKQKGVVFKKTFLNLDKPALAAKQMFDDWKDELGLSPEESYRAVKQGLKALKDFEAGLRRRSREVLDQLVREQRMGVVVLARPYHNDPGVNHEICEELQKLGYPIFWQDTLPLDEDILDQVFGAEVAAGEFKSPLSIEDVWKNSYSENTSRKIWAAKYAARHPNLVALELSSFKCGHDAPIYSNIEEIIERSGTPYFCFKDIDENKPTGSIRIRIETIAYFLKRYRERMVREQAKRAAIEAKLAELAVQWQDSSPAEAGAVMVTV